MNRLLPPGSPHRTMFRGDAFTFPVQVFQPAALIPNSPLVPANITGWTFYSTLKYSVVDPDNQALTQSSTTNSMIAIVSPLSGILLVTWPPLATKNLPDGPVDLVYDVKSIDTHANPATIELGEVRVWPNMSRLT